MRMKEFRQTLLEARGFYCEYCGKDLNPINSTLDHVVPKTKGGSNCLSNIKICCKSCNSAKHNRSIEEFRYTMRMKSSKYHGVISATTAKKLIEEFGLPIELPEYKFKFEMEAENGSY